MKKLATTLVFGLLVLTSKAQDIHFTMFQLAPTIANPAAAGLFSGTFRVGVNYRSQWRSVTPNPYRTFSFNMDGSILKNKRKNAYLGGSLNAFRDISGSTKFGTTKISGSLAGIIHMNKYSSLSIGLKGGWSQFSMDDSGFQWDSQYNGAVYDPSLPSNEDFMPRASDHFDFGAGIMWSYSTSAATLASFDDMTAEVGLAYHHLTNPDLLNLVGTDELYSRYVLHGDILFAIPYSKIQTRPRFNVQVQGPAAEVNLGLLFRYFKRDGSKYTGRVQGWAFSLGAYYRVLDAISPTAEFEYGGLTAGFSYDFTLSKLTPANYGLGGAEVFLKFQNPNPFFGFHRQAKYRF